LNRDEKELVVQLMENVDIEESEAKVLIRSLKGANGDEVEEKPELDDEIDFQVDAGNDELEDGNDVEYLRDGECELCDRYIKLTKHHLLPKETWSRMQTKFLHAADAKSKGEMDKVFTILGPGLSDMVDKLSLDRSKIREILQNTCEICRPCHSAVHRAHSNMELAMNFNSVEKLLSDESIRKFCQWASKQRAGKHKR
jgi:hypothetical protein